MTATTSSLPLRAAEAVANALSTALALPPRLDGGDGDSPRWRHQSLSKGAAGVAILHAVRAQAGHGDDERVHAWLTRAVVEDLSVGLGAHLLHCDPDGDLVRRVLDYLVRLTEPVPAHDDAGPSAPGWSTNDALFGQPEVSGGHADLGMAHGISGPLALLALAMRRGVTVAGHAEAIDRICHWLDTWRQQAPAGPWWPERISLADLRTGRPSQRGPARPSWC